MSNIYTSLPLRRKTLSTRILKLLPGSADEPIRCTLRVVRINAYLSYEALSYTWGDSAHRVEVQVNGQPLPVTRNLGAALCALRLPSRVRHVWVDAICINQDDIRERAMQVAEMGHVYRNATRVLIWLGTTDPWRPWLHPFKDECVVVPLLRITI